MTWPGAGARSRACESSIETLPTAFISGSGFEGWGVVIQGPFREEWEMRRRRTFIHRINPFIWHLASHSAPCIARPSSPA